MSDTSRPRRVVVVVGVATDVGKTWVGARLLTAAREAGLRVAARKPAQSFAADDGRPTDAEVLAEATGEDPRQVCPPHRSYPLAMAPPMAADRLAPSSGPLLLAELVSEIRWTAPDVDVGLVETVGGARSPVAHDGDSAQLAAALRPDLAVLVADAGLGTINAVRLSTAALAAEARSAPVVVVLNRFDPNDPLHLANARWLRERDGCDVVTTADDAWARRIVSMVERHEGDARMRESSRHRGSALTTKGVSMSDRWLVGADDLGMITRAWEARLAVTDDPRHRAILETMLRHLRTEGSGDLEGVIDTLTDEPLFIHADGTRRSGRDAIRDFYSEMFTQGGLGNMRVENVRLVVDDDAIVTQSRVSWIVPWWMGREMGYDIPEESGHYATHRHLCTVLPFDDEGRLIGEHSYARAQRADDWDRVPDGELSPGYLAWLEGVTGEDER